MTVVCLSKRCSFGILIALVCENDNGLNHFSRDLLSTESDLISSGFYV